MTTRALMMPFAKMLGRIGRINSLKEVALQQDAAIEFSRDA